MRQEKRHVIALRMLSNAVEVATMLLKA